MKTTEDKPYLEEPVQKETTKEQMEKLCGEPHEKRNEGDTELWLYKFITKDKLYRVGISFRFDKDRKYSGYASTSNLINPSHILLTISEKVWQENGTSFLRFSLWQPCARRDHGQKSSGRSEPQPQLASGPEPVFGG